MISNNQYFYHKKSNANTHPQKYEVITNRVEHKTTKATHDHPVRNKGNTRLNLSHYKRTCTMFSTRLVSVLAILSSIKLKQKQFNHDVSKCFYFSIYSIVLILIEKVHDHCISNTQDSVNYIANIVLTQSICSHKMLRDQVT